MRTLHVIRTTDPTGGGPIEGLRQLSAQLAEMGHETEILGLDAPDSPWLQKELSHLKIHAIGRGMTGYGYSSELVPWLRKHASNYDAVFARGVWQYSSFGVWQALHGSQTPYYVFPHGMLDPWFKHTYPLKHLKKCLYWPWAEYRVLRDARAVLFTCEEEKLLARESFWPYRVTEIVVNYGTAGPSGDPGAQCQLFFERFPQLRQKRLLLFLSRIHVKKGCDLLIEAFAQVAKQDPALHLVMAGPDQTGWQPKLHAQASALGIADRITWTGMLSGDLKWGAFHTADAFVLPSHQENFGIAVVEALACGVPVLISNKVNIWREIRADNAGIIEEDTIEGTVKLLREWLGFSEAQQALMRSGALQCFANRFEIKRAAQSIVDVVCAHRTEAL